MTRAGLNRRGEIVRRSGWLRYAQLWIKRCRRQRTSRTRPPSYPGPLLGELTPKPSTAGQWPRRTGIPDETNFPTISATAKSRAIARPVACCSSGLDRSDGVSTGRPFHRAPDLPALVAFGAATYHAHCGMALWPHQREWVSIRRSPALLLVRTGEPEVGLRAWRTGPAQSLRGSLCILLLAHRSEAGNFWHSRCIRLRDRCLLCAPTAQGRQIGRGSLNNVAHAIKVTVCSHRRRR